MDPGLQPERTALAWRRTSLSILVNGLLLLRASVQASSALLGVLSTAVILAAVFTFAVVPWRARSLLTDRPQPVPTIMLWVVVGSTWLACVAAILSFVFGHLR